MPGECSLQPGTRPRQRRGTSQDSHSVSQIAKCAKSRWQGPEYCRMPSTQPPPRMHVPAAVIMSCLALESWTQRYKHRHIAGHTHTHVRVLASTAPFILDGTSVSEHSPLVCPLVHEADATTQTPVLLTLRLGAPTSSHPKGSHQIPLLLREPCLRRGRNKLWPIISSSVWFLAQ